MVGLEIMHTDVGVEGVIYMSKLCWEVPHQSLLRCEKSKTFKRHNIVLIEKKSAMLKKWFLEYKVYQFSLHKLRPFKPVNL